MGADKNPSAALLSINITSSLPLRSDGDCLSQMGVMEKSDKCVRPGYQKQAPVTTLRQKDLGEFTSGCSDRIPRVCLKRELFPWSADTRGLLLELGLQDCSWETKNKFETNLSGTFQEMDEQQENQIPLSPTEATNYTTICALGKL